MATISRAEAEHLARLARLDLAPEELDQLTGQLDAIAGYVAQVAEVVADDIPPTSHSVPVTNIFRDDELRPGLTPRAALAAAPDTEDGRFRVPRILAEEV
jgi:aspartyl-tRNA(Asn)/glutamyl-tRNA(Gln) amidotransferase subunit C